MGSTSITQVRLQERCSEISRCNGEDIRGTAGQASVWRFEPHSLPWPKSIPKVDGVKCVWYRPGQDPSDSATMGLTAIIEWNSATGRLVNSDDETIESFIGVCSHARHDVCCGERGKQVLRRIQQFDEVEPVFSCSHLGGDRFAANMVILPEGLLLGRVDELSDVQLRQILQREALPVEVIRGRIGIAPVLGATEIWYRQERQITSFSIDATFAVREETDDNCWLVEVAEPDEKAIIVEARLEEAGVAAQFTCGAEKLSPLQHWVIRKSDQPY